MELEKKKEMVQAVLDARSTCAELRAVATEWMEAAGTEKEKEVSYRLIAELEDDVLPIGAMQAFFASDKAVKVFGEERAAAMKAHVEEIRAAGAKYCDCPACTAGKAILDAKKAFIDLI